METPGTSRSFKTLGLSTDDLPRQRKYEEHSGSIDIDDESKLLSVFPEEIWLKVLASVNPPDLESVNNASPFFRRLLYPERTTFLFSSVWKILGVQYEYDADPVYCDLELEDLDLNDIRVKQAKRVISVILKLRLVCREWCLAVEKFYQDLYSYDTQHSMLKARVESGLDKDDEDKINRSYHKDHSDFSLGHWRDFEFCQPEEVRDFMEHFMPTHDSRRNPFPFRKVSFGARYIDGRSEIIDYCSQVVQLLTKYGHHIWFCELIIYFPNKIHTWSSSRSDLLVKIQKMLTMMPNLQVLRFIMGDYSTSRASCEEEEQMREALLAHPVPRLESLRMLSFQFTPQIIIEKILENNDHVEKVEFRANHGEDLDFAQVRLPKLTQLAVYLTSIEEFEQLEKYGPLWQLEMLHLDLHHFTSYISRSRVFKCLEQWKNSLTDVVVILQKLFWKRGDDKAKILEICQLRLDLPRVKQLRILMYNIPSLDFLLPMKNSLELLEFGFCTIDADWIPKELQDEIARNEVIEFQTDAGCYYHSNIWYLFPKLERIHITEYYDSNGPAFIRQKWKALHFA